MRSKQKKPGLICEELEPRLLFSAGGLEVVAPLNDQLAGLATERVLSDTELPSATAQKPPNATHASTEQTTIANQPVKQFADLLVAGDESLVNPVSPNIEETSGANRGSHSAIAMDAAGNTVVVWSDAARDGSGFGVYAQRFDASGTKVGSEIQVNTVTDFDQRHATVAMDDSGRFAVAFTSTDGDEEGIYLRRFQADGTAIDEAQLLVNSGVTAGSQINPSVAINGSGEMVIAWENNGASQGIYSRHFDMVTAAPGNQLPTTLIAVETGSSADKPSADINNNGRIVITWEQSGDLYGRRYDHNNSNALSSRHDLNLAGSGEHTVNVAVQSNGDFAIVYRSDVFLFNGTWVRHFDADGGSKGFASQLDNGGQNASISVGSDDSFVVVFEDGDADGNGVFARRYDSGLSAQGGVFQVNSSTTGDQQYASVVVDDINNYSIVWSGIGTQTGEEDSNGVFKRQYGTAVANSAPNATNLNTAEAYVEDTPLNLSDIVVTDSDNSNTTVTLTLSDLSAGTLSTATAGAVSSTFDAAKGVWQASGAIAGVNTLLAGVVFSPSLNYNSNFSIATSVTDGIAAPITGTKLFTGSAVNDTPSATNLNAAETFIEDNTLNLSDIVVTDADNTTTTVTLTLSDTTAGSLSTATAGTVSSTFDEGTGVWQASGNITNVNTLLQNLSFTPSLHYDSNFSIATTVDDGSTAPPSPTVSGTKLFTAIAVNDAPKATNLSTSESYVEDTPLNLTNIVAGDVDDTTTRAVLQLSDPAAGSLSTATAGTVTSTFDAIAGTWVADGAIADVNALLADVVFTPSSNYNANFNLQTSVEDGANPAATGTKVFTATASNDAPVVSNINAPESYTEDTALNLTNMVVSDVDSSNVTVTLSLSDTTAGTLSTATAGSVTSTFNALTGEWQASGAIANINTLLANLEFAPAQNYNGNFTINVNVSDGIAPAVTGTKAVTGNAVNDDPIAQATTPAAIFEGDTIVFNASGSTDVDGSIQNYEWDIGADGSYELSSTAPSISLTWDSLNSFGITDDGDYQVQLKVRDNGGATDTQTFIVSVNNTAPIVSLAGQSSISVGDTFLLTISANDPGSDSLTNLFIEWGDGSSENISGGEGTYAHVYTVEDASRVIQVTASDEDGTYTPMQIATAVTANNQPGGEISIDNPGGEVAVGDTLTLNNTLSDADGFSSAISFQWLRNGSDISGANGNSYVVTEADAGAAISVVASYTDGLGNPESVTSTISVSVPAINQAPSLLLSDTSITLLENSDTSARIALSNVSVLDDGLGSNTLTLAGDNANLFEIDAGILYLKAGVALDFETAMRLEVSVQVDDAAIGSGVSGIDDSELFTLNVEDVDETEDTEGTEETGGTGDAGDTGNENQNQNDQDLALPSDLPINPPPNSERDPTAAEPTNTDTETDTADEAANNDAAIENASAEPLDRLPGTGGTISFIENPNQTSPSNAIDGIPLDQAIRSTFAEQNTINFNPATINVALLEQLSSLNLDDPALRNTLLQLEAQQTTDPMDNFSLLENSLFVNGLDDVRLNLQQHETSDQMLIGSSIMATTSLSVGYVIWLIRGSVLLSSLLSSLPAWRIIDPLPVLAGALHENDEDDESLQSMLEGEQDEDLVSEPAANETKEAQENLNS